MKVLFVTSEAVPLMKTGGLADVSGALPAALMRAGMDVRVMLPAYPQALAMVENKRSVVSFGDPLGVGEVGLIAATMPSRGPGAGTPLLLVDCPQLFAREGNPYSGPDGEDWPDNHLRFAILSRVAAMVSQPGNLLGWTPDIVHANDWQTGLIPAYLHYWGGRHARSVFTVHNLLYQGVFPPDILPALGLPRESYNIDGLEFHNQVSFLKAGLYYSDALTTVSPTYAREIQTSEHGCGMEGLLRLRANVLSGLLNGIDDDEWNPQTDARISHTYSVEKLAGKAKNKAKLQAELGLPVEAKAPLFGMVSRLTGQKGVDMIADAMPTLVARGAQVAILGSGDKTWEAAFTQLADAFPQVSVTIGYNEDLAHRIIAGSDIFMMPSRFEPCGLTQMYALRYGTLPLVRRTGGLADSVVDVENVAGSEGTGFVFDEPTTIAFTSKSVVALELYGNQRKWKKVQRTAMAQDFSWETAADGYKSLYTKLLMEAGLPTQSLIS